MHSCDPPPHFKCFITRIPAWVFSNIYQHNYQRNACSYCSVEIDFCKC
uniref:Uncharacterized protein n=1 Tax=Anguilla anguilla TaxID=7936 RepID=A0A0E9PA61_ANGAN